MFPKYLQTHLNTLVQSKKDTAPLNLCLSSDQCFFPSFLLPRVVLEKCYWGRGVLILQACDWLESPHVQDESQVF